MSETPITCAPGTALAASPSRPDLARTTSTKSEAVAPSLGAARKPQTKRAQVLDLLRRPEGATLVELVEATGCLPHTTRAALTGLRKKGHVINNHKIERVTRYTTAGAPNQ